MTGTEVALIITASGAFITSAGGVYISVLNRRLSLTNAGKIEEVRQATDGMKNELVALTRKDAHGEGMREGDAAGHTRGVQEGIELASTVQP